MATVPGQHARHPWLDPVPFAPALTVAHVFTDGSCEQQELAAWRYSGAGVWSEDFGLQLAEPVPGLEQSNIAGEVFALMLAIEQCPGPSVIHIDCQLVIDTFELVSRGVKSLGNVFAK